MASCNGIISERARPAVHPQIAARRFAAAKAPIADPYRAKPAAGPWPGAQASRGCVISPAAFGALTGHSFGDENLFHRIWFEPRVINAGFITGDQKHTITVWNAWQDRVAEFSSVSSLDSQGTRLEMKVPDRIPATAEASGTLWVLGQGPPLQSTQYTFVVDSGQYLLLITGMRVITLTMEPDWGSDLAVDYMFDTVIASNRRLHEQRRPLLPAPRRRVKASYLADGHDQQVLANFAAYGHDKVFGVPVYTEGFRAEALHAGSTSVTAAEDVDLLWNLQHLSQYLLIVDHDAQYGEIKKMKSHAGRQIELAQPLGRDFDPDRAIIYPIFLGTLETATRKTAAPQVEIIALDFQEFSYGQ